MYDPPPDNNGGPPAEPLPLGEAVRRLPSIYWRVFTRPSAATFAAELGGARWDIVWTQILGLMLIDLVYTLLWQMFFMPHFMAVQAVFSPSGVSSLGASPVPPPFPLQTILNWERVVIFVITLLSPALFFMVQGIYYVLARLFHGQGTFLAQCYASTLVSGPTTVVGLLAGLLTGLSALFPTTLPFVWLVTLPLSIYYYVLQVMATMATYRLDSMKAAGVVLIPLAALMLFACIIGVALGIMLSVYMMSHMSY